VTTFVAFHLFLQLVNVIFSRTSPIFFLTRQFSNNQRHVFLNVLQTLHDIKFYVYSVAQKQSHFLTFLSPCIYVLYDKYYVLYCMQDMFLTYHIYLHISGEFLAKFLTQK